MGLNPFRQQDTSSLDVILVAGFVLIIVGFVLWAFFGG